MHCSALLLFMCTIIIYEMSSNRKRETRLARNICLSQKHFPSNLLAACHRNCAVTIDMAPSKDSQFVFTFTSILMVVPSSILGQLRSQIRFEMTRWSLFFFHQFKSSILHNPILILFQSCLHDETNGWSNKKEFRVLIQDLNAGL